MLPPPAVFVGGGDAIGGGISSEINFENFLIVDMGFPLYDGVNRWNCGLGE